MSYITLLWTLHYAIHNIIMNITLCHTSHYHKHYTMPYIMNIAHLCKEVWDLFLHWHVFNTDLCKMWRAFVTLANNVECPFSDANSFNFSMYCWASFSVIPLSLEHVASGCGTGKWPERFNIHFLEASRFGATSNNQWCAFLASHTRAQSYRNTVLCLFFTSTVFIFHTIVYPSTKFKKYSRLIHVKYVARFVTYRIFKTQHEL